VAPQQYSYSVDKQGPVNVMSAAQNSAVAEQAGHDAAFSCLDEPVRCGFASVQAYFVDRIKRVAIRLLHRSVRGECWMLRMCFIAEVTTECTLHEDWTGQTPDWLVPLIAQHLEDEQHHAAAFAKALQARGASAPETSAPDWLSRRKIFQWRNLAHRYAPCFAHDLLVPTYAIGMCAEQMAMRVLARHCEVIGDGHAMYSLFSRVLTDEARHVQLCRNVLLRLVAPAEARQLAALLREIRAIDAGFGVTGALIMYAVGWFYWLRSGAPGSHR